jgi:hypothetical protein
MPWPVGACHYPAPREKQHPRTSRSGRCAVVVDCGVTTSLAARLLLRLVCRFRFADGRGLAAPDHATARWRCRATLSNESHGGGVCGLVALLHLLHEYHAAATEERGQRVRHAWRSPWRRRRTTLAEVAKVADPGKSRNK